MFAGSSGVSSKSSIRGQIIPIYVINLDRSVDRLEKVKSSSIKFGIEFHRVKAIEGPDIPPKERHILNKVLFALRCGRWCLPGEYGCYISHLEALKHVAEGPAEVALILEDDVEFTEDFCETVKTYASKLPQHAVLKLVNHRSGGFLKLAEVPALPDFGVCSMGPQGSAATYVVTRKGAQRLLRRLGKMSLPYDVALERAWATGVNVFTTKDNILPFAGGQRGETLIGTSNDYRSTKFLSPFRVPSFLFKGLENIFRAGYAFIVRLTWKREA